MKQIHMMMMIMLLLMLLLMVMLLSVVFVHEVVIFVHKVVVGGDYNVDDDYTNPRATSLQTINSAYLNPTQNSFLEPTSTELQTLFLLQSYNWSL